MPFRRIGNDRYKSPSGKIFTRAMMQAYYAKENDNAKTKAKRKNKKAS